MLPLAHFDCDPGEDGYAEECDDRKPDVDEGEIYKGCDYRDGADDDVFRTVVSQLGNVLQVVGDAGHQAAGLVVVEETVGQLLVVFKNLAAHLCLHSDAHHVALVLDKVFQAEPCGVYAQEQNAAPDDGAGLLVRDEVVEHAAGYDGVDDRQQRHYQRRPHVQAEYELVGFVIWYKSFDQTHAVRFSCLCLKLGHVAPPRS